MSFEDIMVLIGFAAFMVLPLYMGLKFAKTGTRERDQRYPCPRCGTPVPFAATYCTGCLRKIPTSTFVVSGAAAKNTFRWKGLRFLIGFFAGFFLESAVAIGILYLM